MKIAFIVNEFPCVSETFVLNQITGLIDQGHEVDIFAQRPGTSPTMHADVEKYRLLDRTLYIDAKAILSSLNYQKFGGRNAFLRLIHKVIPFLGKGP